MADAELVGLDEQTAIRMANATRVVEALYSPQRTQSPGSPSINPMLSQRGWLLEPVSHGDSASVLLTQYNPGFSAYIIHQFGLWTTTGTFTLSIQIGTQTITGTFTNPSPSVLEVHFAAFQLKAFCGNPLLGNYAGIKCTKGKTNHFFWILAVPAKNVTFTLSSSPSYLTDGRDFTGNRISEIPVSVVTAFDALELDWELSPGSRVILNNFDRGLGIVSAKPNIVYST